MYLSIINCVWMHRCECVVISLSYKCQCILICTYTMIRLIKWIWIYLLCGQEVWSEPSMGARMVPANGQTTNTKKIFYMLFWLERLSILLQIYTFACNFCSRKGGGGVLLLGSMLLLGHIQYIYLFSLPFIFENLIHSRNSQILRGANTFFTVGTWEYTIKTAHCGFCGTTFVFPSKRTNACRLGPKFVLIWLITSKIFVLASWNNKSNKEYAICIYLIIPPSVPHCRALYIS